MCSLEVADTTLSCHWRVSEIFGSMYNDSWNFNRMLHMIRKNIKMEGTVMPLCKNFACPHLEYWMLFYSLHLKMVQMKLKMLEEKGIYNSQGAEAIKWLMREIKVAGVL